LLRCELVPVTCCAISLAATHPSKAAAAAAAAASGAASSSSAAAASSAAASSSSAALQRRLMHQVPLRPSCRHWHVVSPRRLGRRALHAVSPANFQDFSSHQQHGACKRISGSHIATNATGRHAKGPTHLNHAPRTSCRTAEPAVQEAATSTCQPNEKQQNSSVDLNSKLSLQKLEKLSFERGKLGRTVCTPAEHSAG
jgi:hypothetical protein